MFENAQSLDLRHANLTNIHGNQYNVNYRHSRHLIEERALATLKPAKRGPYFPRCMEGTRESVFREIDTWLDDFGAFHSTIQCMVDFLTIVLSRDHP